MPLLVAIFRVLLELGEACAGRLAILISVQVEGFLEFVLKFMHEIVFKRKRRCPKSGKVKVAKSYTGRYQISADSKVMSVSLYTSDKQVAYKRLQEIVVKEQKKACGLICSDNTSEEATLFKKILEGYISDMRGRDVKDTLINTPDVH